MADGVEVGRAHVAVTADARTAVRNVERDFAAGGKRAGRGFSVALSTGLKSTGIGLIVSAAAGLVAGLGKAVSSAGTFEKSMRLVGVTTKVGEAGLKDLTATAIEMGKKTSFSAQGASDAMVELAKGGLTAAQIQGGALEQTLTLATAGGLELGSAASYMVSGLKAFGLQAADSGRVAAALAGGANASTASVESMGLALQQSAAQAATAGLSIEDTTGAIAALANNGIQGSDAGTSLKVMLQRLVPQTDKAKGSMEELGLITKDGTNRFFDAAGNMKSMSEVAGLLQNALKDQTKEQKINTLYRLFGSDATRAAAILTKEGAAGLAEYTKATSDQTAAQNLAQNATKGFAGAWERFSGTIETIGIQIGTFFLPILTRLLNFASNAIEGISGLGGRLRAAFSGGGGGGFFSGLITQIRQLVAVIAPIVQQIVAAIIGKFQQMRPQLQSIWTSIKTIVTGVMFIIREVIQAVTTIIRLIWARWGTQITTIVKTVFGGLVNIISGVMKVVAGVIKLAVALIKGDWSGAWGAIKQIFAGAWQALGGILRVVTAGLLAILAVWWAKVKSLWTTAWGTLKNVVQVAVAAVAKVLKTVIAIWTFPIRLAMTVIGTIMALAWLAIRKPVLAAFTFIRDRVIRPGVAAWTALFRSAMAIIRSAWTAFWGVIRSVVSVAWNFVYRNIISPVWTRIRSLWTSNSSAVRSTWNSFWTAIRTATSNAINAVHDRIRTVLDKIKNAFSTAKANIKKIWDGVQEVVSKPVRWIVDHVYNSPLVPVWNRVAGLVSGPKLSAYAEGGQIRGPRHGRDNILGISRSGGATAMVEPGEWVAPRWMSALFPTLESIRRRGRGRFKDEGTATIPGLAGGGVVGWLKGLVGSAGGTISNLAGKIKDWVLGGLRSAAGKLLDPVKGLIERAMPSSGVGKTVGGIGKKAIDLVLDKIKTEDAKALAATTGGPAGSAIATGGWASIYKALRAAGARNFTTYAGHDQGASRSRDITPPSQRIADTARRLSSIWYVIYNRRIASITHGMRWRPYTRYGPNASPSQAHTNHVHVTLRPGVKAATGGLIPDFAKYDRGGVLKPGLTMAYNGTGRDEQVVPHGRGAGGVNIYGGQFGYDPASIGREILREQRHQQALNPVFA